MSMSLKLSSILKRILLVVPIVVALNLSKLTNIGSVYNVENDESILEKLANCLLGVNPIYSTSYLVDMLIGSIGIILFMVLFAGFIADDLKISSIYYFSRIKNRGGFIAIKNIQFFGLSVAYSVVLVFTNLVCAYVLCEDRELSGYVCRQVVKQILVISIAIYIFASISNLISIRIGNTKSFIITALFYYLLVTFEYNYINNPELEVNKVVEIISPVHKLYIFNFQINTFKSIIIFAITTLIIYLVTYYLVEKTDFILIENE